MLYFKAPSHVSSILLEVYDKTRKEVAMEIIPSQTQQNYILGFYAMTPPKMIPLPRVSDQLMGRNENENHTPSTETKNKANALQVACGLES